MFFFHTKRISFQFLSQTQLATRCDFPLYYPGALTLKEENFGINSLYLERKVFLTQSASLFDNLKQIWHQRKFKFEKFIYSISKSNSIYLF